MDKRIGCDSSIIYLNWLTKETRNEKNKTIKDLSHTSGEDKAEFWNGTGAHKTGTSTPDNEVKRVLQSADNKS